MELAVAAAAAVHVLVERHETLASAESLTGGLIANTIVEIPGVSSVFRGGLVVYATDLKHTLAGVPEQLLAERGAVDPDPERDRGAGAAGRGAARGAGRTAVLTLGS